MYRVGLDALVRISPECSFLLWKKLDEGKVTTETTDEGRVLAM